MHMAHPDSCAGCCRYIQLPINAVMTEAWQNKWQPLPDGTPLPGAEGTTQGMPAALLVAWTCARSSLLAEYCIACNISQRGLAGVFAVLP